MECRNVRRVISREIDGASENAERAELEKHCASCEACRRFRDACLVGLSVHRSMREIAPPPSMLPSILAAVERRPQRRWAIGWPAFAVAGAAAAAAVIGFWVGGLVHETYNPVTAQSEADVLELTYLDEYPPGSFGDILTASYEGGGDEQR